MVRFHITAERAGASRHLLLRGEFDLPAYDALRSAIGQAVADPGVEHVIIDLAGATFLDCGAVGVMVQGRNLALARSCGYDLVGARDEPLTLLRLLGFDADDQARSAAAVER